jgi:predicted O-methyltransferase YrrM
MELLRDKPHTRGAEIGVFKGLFANRLLRNLPDIKVYYCVDPWLHSAEYKKTLRNTSGELKTPPNNSYRVFLRNTAKWQHKRIVLRMTSMEALEKVADNSLDWVFIDANHSYEHAKPDILGWSKKVKVGGLISGHDFFDVASGLRKVPFGVDRAVKELIPKFEVVRGANVWWTWKKTEDWVG